MDEELRLQLEADLSKWSSQLDKATADLSKLTSGVMTADEYIDKWQSNLNKTSDQIKGTGSAVGKAAQDTDQFNKSAKAAADHLPRLRYALYDVSSTFAIFGAAALAATVAPAAIAISWERAFADVERTVGGTEGQLKNLEAEFVNLAQTIPVSFQDLANIGSLGGQLDIARGDLADFTKTVAMFTATTDVSLEDSATAFARLNELLPPMQGGFEAIASSILQVGINSIATESQIIAISSQLAGVASQTSMTTDEVFGLSAALASIGTQPELARGTITRTFGQIGRAVSQGGDALENFARISNMTSDQFRSGWSNDSTATLQRFLEGIGSKEGPEAEAALRSLGLTATRDTTVLLKLAQNTDLLASNLADAAEGANEASELTRQYSIIADTTAEKLKLLGNNFQALLAAIGESTTGLGGLIDALTGVLQYLTQMASDPFWSVIGAGALVIGALTAVLALMGGAAARTAASVLALRTAMNDLGISSIFARGALTTVTGHIVGAGTAAGGATVAMRTLGTALKALSVIGLGIIAIEVGSAIYEWGASADDVAIDFDALGVAISTAGVKAEEWSNLTQTMARNSLNFSSLWSDQDVLSSVEERLQYIAVAQDTLTSSADRQRVALDLLNSSHSQFATDLGEVESKLIAAFNAGQALESTKAFEGIKAQLVDMGASQETINALFSEYLSLATSAEGREIISSQQIAAASEEFRLLGEEIKGVIDAEFEIINASVSAQNAIYDLGAALAENGAGFSEYSQAGRDNLSALGATIQAIAAQTPGDAAATANNLQALFNTIVQGGYASSEQLRFLSGMISNLGGSTGAASVKFDALKEGFKSYVPPARKAASATREAAKEIRTLADYANDLSSVFGRAFDIQFGPQTAMDSITLKWIELNEQLRDYREEVARLTADRKTTAYFLSIAEAYGDQLRAGELRADLLKIDNELADAQANVSKETVGNSKAAAQNRGILQGLVKQYQDYITALASSGADQATLNAAVDQSEAEFRAQAIALGFADASLQPYIQSFRGLVTVINSIPRNITVNTSGLNPAMAALAEFNAKINEVRNNAAQGINTNLSTSVDKSGIRAELEAKIASLNGQLMAEYARLGGNGNLNTNRMELALRELRAALSRVGYAKGGYTGDGGMYQPAGVVHKGEFVFSKKATANMGVGQLNAMHAAAKNGRGYATGGAVAPRVASPSGPNVFVLDQAQYQGLVDSGRVVVQIGADQLANATNAANQQYANLGRG